MRMVRCLIQSCMLPVMGWCRIRVENTGVLTLIVEMVPVRLKLDMVKDVVESFEKLQTYDTSPQCLKPFLVYSILCI